MGEELSDADKALIEAAPELLAALERSVVQIEHMHNIFRETISGNLFLDTARAAIAKARGEAL